jgi:arginine repressor
VKKTAEKTASKADLIRKVAGIIKAKGEKPRPKEIVRILTEEGITVAPAQVSMTLKAAGFRKRRKGKKAAVGAVAKKAVSASRSGQISVDDLIAAKKLVGAFGGTDNAIAALQALKRLEG